MTTHTAHGIGELVTRIQDEFLDTPGLTLTPVEAQDRFALDPTTSGALLEFLADAGVLARFFRDGQHAFLLRRGREERTRTTGTRRGTALRSRRRPSRHAA